MRRALLTIVCLAIASAAKAADEKPARPPVPPRLYTIGKIDQQVGEVMISCVTVRFVWQPNRMPIYETRSWSLPLASTDCFDAQGKKLTADEVYKRLAVGAVVVVSVDATEVDPLFLKALAKDTLVFVSAEYAVNNVLASADPSGQNLKVGIPLEPRVQ